MSSATSLNTCVCLSFSSMQTFINIFFRIQCSLKVTYIFFSEVNSGFFYKSAAEREKLVQAEREFIDERVRKIIALKKQVCEGNNKSFYVINQKVGKSLSLSLSV